MAAMKKDPNPLGELVDAVCEANGWARADVWRWSEAHGGGLRKSNTGRLCTDDPLDSISAARIFDLAAALRVSPARVALAALEAMGVSVTTTDRTTAEVVASDPQLSVPTKRAILAILRSSGDDGRGIA
jgi:hypothetical protein